MVTVLHTQLDLVRDFVNTLDFETGIDTIASPDELASGSRSRVSSTTSWSRPTKRSPMPSPCERPSGSFCSRNNGVDADAAGASKTLEEAGRKAHLGVRFEDGRPVLAPEGDGARGAIGRIVAAVAELAPTEEWKRLKGCRDEHCRVAFYDKSRNRSRAWCSMEVCGNREKARSFRKRHATA